MSGREADIRRYDEISVFKIRHVGGHGERSRLVLHLFQAAAVGKEEIIGVLAVLVKGCEEFQHSAEGVRSLFGRRTVRRFSADPKSIALFIEVERDAFVRRVPQDFFGSVGGEDRDCVVAHHVHSFARREGTEGRILQGEGSGEMKDSFFRIDGGEIRVGREAFLGHFCHLIIVVDTGPAALLVTAYDQLYFAAGLEAFVFQRFKAIEHGYCGPLVVHGAAAPDFDTGHAAFRGIVVDYGAEGRKSPTAAGGNDVEVCENCKLLPFSENNLSDVVIVIVRLKPHIRCERKEVVKTVCGLFTEGIISLRGFQGRIEFHRFTDRFDNIVKIVFHYMCHINHRSFFLFFIIIHAFSAQVNRNEGNKGEKSEKIFS